MNLGSLIPRWDKSHSPTARDDIYEPMVTFRREVDRMFGDFFSGFGDRALRHHGWHGLAPAIDVAETDKDFVVTAELPGLDEKDFEVTLSRDILTIKGEKRSELGEDKGGLHYMERHFGSFTRSVRLPFAVKDEAVDANYDKGVLTVRVPKPAEVQKAVRRIDVKAR